MILSHKYRYIFIKTNKTAGTSVEIALSKFCGPEDIITPLTKEDEVLRSSLGYPGPQNHEAPLSEYALRDYWRRLYRGRKKARFYNHMPAAEIKLYVDKAVWNDYFKFCIERNPWDRLISYYYWQKKIDPACGLDTFLNSDIPLKLRRRGFDLYSLDGEIMVDKVCLFENLAEDLEEVRQRIGLPKPLPLPRTKKASREDRRHYREILNEEQKNRIADLFSREIALHDYRF